MMIFGYPQPDLMPGARNAVGTCLAIRAGERVALIADDASAAVAASLEQALAEVGAVATVVRVESGQRRVRNDLGNVQLTAPAQATRYRAAAAQDEALVVFKQRIREEVRRQAASAGRGQAP
jgi:leucyl aminopeptidase (aminopeptidase T)